MAKQFTEWGKQVLSGARSEAGRLGSDHVRTEHILLALCRDPDSTAVRAFAGLGVDVQALTAAIDQQVQPGTPTLNVDEITFAPRAKRVIELAIEESNRLNQDYIGTEHLLLGLLKEGGGTAAGMLRDRGIDTVGAQAEIGRLTEPDIPAAAVSDFSLTPRVKKALELARAEMEQEREFALRTGALEKAAWWRSKERALLSLLDEPRCEGNGTGLGGETTDRSS
jgi:ATP-dependent Clp protease ATP-binding subunit ClpA